MCYAETLPLGEKEKYEKKLERSRKANAKVKAKKAEQRVAEGAEQRVAEGAEDSSSEEEPNECEKCGACSYKYSTELCEPLAESLGHESDAYYCYECIEEYRGDAEDEGAEDS